MRCRNVSRFESIMKMKFWTIVRIIMEARIDRAH